MEVSALGKWNKSSLFWEISKGEVSFSITDENLRFVASRNQDYPFCYLDNVIRHRDTVACFDALITKKTSTTILHR